MTRIIHCPKCHVELTIPSEAGERRLRCPKCAERFYPDGESPSKEVPPPSTYMALNVDKPQAAPKKKAKVPPSSGAHPSASGTGPPPSSLPELREMVDIPLVEDDAPFLPSRPGNAVADVSALFNDAEPVERRRRPQAEARREARRCTACGDLVPQGMSLCENCGLDQDTGQRYELADQEEEPYYDSPQAYAYDSTPPAIVILIGILALAVSIVLAGLAFLELSGISLILLIPICFFGVFAAIQFLRGKSLQLMIVALLLGGGVDLVVLVIMPIVLAEEQAIQIAPEADDFGAVKKPTVTPTADGEAAEPIAGVKVKALTERIDYTKMTFGIAIFIIDAIMLITLSLPSVRSYFDRPRYHYDENKPILI